MGTAEKLRLPLSQPLEVKLSRYDILVPGSRVPVWQRERTKCVYILFFSFLSLFSSLSLSLSPTISPDDRRIPLHARRTSYRMYAALHGRHVGWAEVFSRFSIYTRARAYIYTNRINTRKTPGEQARAPCTITHISGANPSTRIRTRVY